MNLLIHERELSILIEPSEMKVNSVHHKQIMRDTVNEEIYFITCMCSYLLRSFHAFLVLLTSLISSHFRASVLPLILIPNALLLE